ncbi:MAG: sterol desaturase family protein [Myxococcales bacterium]|nr:sterol desaturase family protein [Myxococcales bacterium]
MSWTLLSPLLIVVAALVLIGLERLLPYEPRQRLFRPEFWSDLLLYTFAQSYVLGLVINQLILWIDDASGMSRWHVVTDWPVGLQFLFFFVTHDLYIYVFHRLQHRVPVLWRLHEAHHSTTDVDWLSGSRSHALEILVNQTIEFAPIVLLGAHPDVALMKGTLDAVWGMYIHSNINVRAGWLQFVLNGPEMHRWHHAKEVEDGHLNYATKLALWDWLFGTAYLPRHKPAAYGMYGYDVPPGYLAQFVFAFRPFSRPLSPRSSLRKAS